MISIRDLSYRFDKRKTDGISNLALEINKSEIISILGPSGAGKTTTLKCIAGFIKDYDGVIEIEKNQSISYMAQSLVFPENMSIFDFLDSQMDQSIDKASRENQIRMTLTSLELTNEMNSKLDSLSAGQKQRVLLASSLVNNPTILLLDEPFSHLDKGLRQQLFHDIFPLFKQKKITVIWVTHSQEEAMNFSDKICLLNFGELQQFGVPKDLYYSPQNLFTARFFGETNTLITSVLELSKDHFSFELMGKEFKAPLIKGSDMSLNMTLVACIRPHFIIISDKKEIEAKLVSSYFQGRDQLINLRVNDQPIWMKIDGNKDIKKINTMNISFKTENIHFLTEV